VSFDYNRVWGEDVERRPFPTGALRITGDIGFGRCLIPFMTYEKYARTGVDLSTKHSSLVGWLESSRLAKNLAHGGERGIESHGCC
jgi:hypothetical protein